MTHHDDYSALRTTAESLAQARTAQEARLGDEISTWLLAGDRLAEKAIAALDTGEAERADLLVRRIVALPVVAGTTAPGPMAVSVLLREEILAPTVPDEAEQGLLERPLRLLPGLDPQVADELRRVLASLTGAGLPTAVVRRIEQVVPAEREQEAPFADVPPERLPAAITGVLRLVLALRGAAD